MQNRWRVGEGQGKSIGTPMDGPVRTIIIIKCSCSRDLDVALSTSSGYNFALDFADYLKGKKVSVSDVGRVAANPEQSKHLETGTTRIMGLECDFVGLRNETYTDSRIPSKVVRLFGSRQHSS